MRHVPHILDTFGLFVQMIVVSICSIFLIGVVALRRSHSSSAEPLANARASDTCDNEEAKRDQSCDDPQEAVEDLSWCPIRRWDTLATLGTSVDIDGASAPCLPIETEIQGSVMGNFCAI